MIPVRPCLAVFQYPPVRVSVHWAPCFYPALGALLCASVANDLPLPSVISWTRSRQSPDVLWRRRFSLAARGKQSRR